MKTKAETLKVYKRSRVRRPTIAEISDEIITEILARLPVKTLVRFKSISKAWHAIISSPFFMRLHLQQSARKQEQGFLSFLVTPHTLYKTIDSEGWPTTFSNNISFYHWQEGQENACLVHSADLQGEFGSVYPMLHCDGLVLLPTDTKVYVFNPAIGDVLKLPHHQEYARLPSFGLGLDPRTRKYKVARSFYRSVDFFERTYSAGMEVFTIGGDDVEPCWKIVAEDPPLPIEPQIPMYFKGSIYWNVCEELLGRPPEGFLSTLSF